MNILNQFFSVYVLNSYNKKSFDRKIKETVKSETVSIDTFKEFCCKGDQRKEAMAGIILFNSQQPPFEVGAIIITPILQIQKLTYKKMK